MGDTNRVALRYVPEVTLGTTPANSTGWKTIRMTSESLLPNYSHKQSEQIRADRNRSDVVQTAASVGGGVNFELSGITMDDWLEAVLGGTWATNVLKVGTTRRSFTIEKEFADLATGNKFEQYRGMRVGEVSFALAYDEIAKGSMTFAGVAAADSAASAVGTGTVAAPLTTGPFNGTTDVIAVEINGAASGLYFQSLNMTLNANLRAKTAIGNLFPFDQGYGSAGVELTASAYFDNRTLETLLRTNANFSMRFEISDGTLGYNILLPRAFVSARSGNSATGQDADVLQELTIQAAFDTVQGSSIVITRDIV